MNTLLQVLLAMTVWTWLCVIAASVVRTKSWGPSGLLLALGNRQNLPPASDLAERAERAARNTVENFVFFAVIALVAQAAGAATPRVVLGAEVFLVARLIYTPVYWLGIGGLRSFIWFVGVIGMVTMLFGILG